jgi:hypothetical protein
VSLAADYVPLKSAPTTATPVYLSSIITFTGGEHPTSCGSHLFDIIALHIAAYIKPEVGSATRRLKSNIINYVAYEKDRFTSAFDLFEIRGSFELFSKIKKISIWSHASNGFDLVRNGNFGIAPVPIHYITFGS